ncbi:hypothetical protein AbraIFM66950_009516 [Aspergillus brasiliensis]|nr:hypothetical protein AbraIFM66950_009516 [Aspergillus brasiliensis]
MSEVRDPTIEMFDPDTGRWVQEQATFVQKLDEDDGQSYMQPPSTNGTQEMRDISKMEGENDIMPDIETRLADSFFKKRTEKDGIDKTETFNLSILDRKRNIEVE